MRALHVLRTIHSTADIRLRSFGPTAAAFPPSNLRFIAPLMITLYLGGVEVSQAVAVNRKTTLVAHTVADLVAQVSKVTNSDMTDVLNASIGGRNALLDGQPHGDGLERGHRQCRRGESRLERYAARHGAHRRQHRHARSPRWPFRTRR